MQSKFAYSDDTESSLFKVKKIETEKHLYIIYAERNDSTFKIISDRDVDEFFDCEKIMKNNYYNLKLSIIFPINSFRGKNFMENLGISRFSYKGDNVKIEKKSHNKLYVVENLKGLCLEKTDH